MDKDNHEGKNEKHSTNENLSTSELKMHTLSIKDTKPLDTKNDQDSYDGLLGHKFNDSAFSFYQTRICK